MTLQLVGAAEERRYDWDYFVADSGEEGRAWLIDYSRPDTATIARGLDEALDLLRKRRLGPGHELLMLSGARLDELRSAKAARASIVSILERWYYGVAAYYYYCVNDMPLAGESLNRADQAIRDAVYADHFLLPLADHCPEFVLHHARIARNLRRWREMWQYIDVVRAMIEERLPLCELADGTKVNYATLAQFCATLPLRSKRAQDEAKAFADVNLRRQHLERSMLELYVIPGFIIPCPTS